MSRGRNKMYNVYYLPVPVYSHKNPFIFKTRQTNPIYSGRPNRNLSGPISTNDKGSPGINKTLSSSSHFGLSFHIGNQYSPAAYI